MMTFEQYVAIPALNWSTLKWILTSPRLLQHRRQHPEPTKPAYSLGTAIHCAALEPERFAEWRPQPDFGDGRTKAAKAARAAWIADNADRVVIPAADYQTAIECAESLCAHVVWPLIEAADRERTIQWEIDGIACKARLDLLMADRIGDLKSTRRSDVDGMRRDMASYLYAGQLAWYHDGAIAAGLAVTEAPMLVFVQSGDAHDVVAGPVSEAMLAAGRALWTRAFRTYRDCMTVGRWPGMAPDLVEWELPPWAAGMGESVDPEGEF